MKLKIEDQIIDVEHSTFIKILKQGKIPPQSLVRSRIITDGKWERVGDLEVFKIFLDGYTASEENLDNLINLIASDESKSSTETQFLSYQNKFPLLTLTLIALNIIIFILQTIYGGSTNHTTLLKFGAYDYSLIIRNNQYWRLISHTFLHIGISHILLNMTVLYFLGMALEGLYGKYRFLILYFLSGLAGGIASLIFVKGPIGAGASGAIFGLIGVMVAFGIQYRDEIPNRRKKSYGLRLLPFILIDIVLGFIIPGVNIAAHIGGLIGGFVMAWFFPPMIFSDNPRKENYAVKSLAILVIGMIILSGALVGLNIPESQADINLYQTKIRERYEEVLNKYESALNKPYDEKAYSLLERVYMILQEEMPEEKDQLNKKLEKLYNKAISEAPKNPVWYNNFAWLYVQMDIESDKAVTLALKAIQLSPDNPPYMLDTLAWAYLRNHQYEKSLETFEKVFDKGLSYEEDIFESTWNGIMEIAQSDVEIEVFMDFYNRMKSKTAGKPNWQDKLNTAYQLVLSRS